MTSSIVNLLKGPKKWNYGFSLIYADNLPNEVLYYQYNVKTQATFSIMSLKNYQIVRKLSIRFLRNSEFLPNCERFSESSFAKNVQNWVAEANYPIWALSIWWFGSKSADQKIILDFLLAKFNPLPKNILYEVLLVQNTLE